MSVYKLAFRSTAIDPITAGTNNIELHLGEPRYLRLEVRGSDGGVIENASASFYWQLAGLLFRDYPGPRRERGKPIWWELPNIPFHVSVSAQDHAAVRLGPLDPDEVGEKLVVELEAYPRVRGRVVHEGEAVAGASVTLRHTSSGWKRVGKTDAAGRFDIAFTKLGSYDLRAWSREVGEGNLGAVTLDPEQVNDELEVEITRSPGSIAGKVMVPPEHDPREIWLTTTRGYGYMCPEPDGSFLLPDLPPGPLTIRVREGYRKGGKNLPVSTTFQRDPEGKWLRMSHGPTRAPDWLTVEPTFDVDVRSGETIEIELDLVAPPACSLQGRVQIDGRVPELRPEEFRMYGRPKPRIVLCREDSSDYVSRTELGTDGLFELHAAAPGTYRLVLWLPMSAGEWSVSDQIELVSGQRAWHLEAETGSLRVLPREEDGHSHSGFGGSVRWSGPGNLRIVASHGDVDEKARTVIFPLVPVGPVELTERRADESLLETEIIAGKTTTVRNP